MILYLDTSALLKRYFKEPYSNELLAKWKEAAQIITSSVAYAETMASLYRKKREVDLSSKIFNKLVNSFHLDWETFILPSPAIPWALSHHPIHLFWPLADGHGSARLL